MGLSTFVRRPQKTLGNNGGSSNNSNKNKNETSNATIRTDDVERAVVIDVPPPQVSTAAFSHKDTGSTTTVKQQQQQQDDQGPGTATTEVSRVGGVQQIVVRRQVDNIDSLDDDDDKDNRHHQQQQQVDHDDENDDTNHGDNDFESIAFAAKDSLGNTGIAARYHIKGGNPGDRFLLHHIKGSGNSLQSRAGLVATLIVVVGCIAFTVILGFGLQAARRDVEGQFQRLASDLQHQFEMAVGDYVAAGNWIHQACRDRTMTPPDFRILYEYLLSTGLEFQAVSFAMNITTLYERQMLENETRTYLASYYPNITYRGFTGFELGPTVPGTTTPVAPVVAVPRSTNASFYFPVHFIQPLENIKNQAALDFDIFTSPQRRAAVEQALATWQPALTDRLKLIQESIAGVVESYAYSAVLMHPGIPLSSSSSSQQQPSVVTKPRDVSVLAIRIPELLSRAHANVKVEESVSVYLFDSSSATTTNSPPQFMGGAYMEAGFSTLTFLNEIELQTLRDQPKQYITEKDFPIASKDWIFVVQSSRGSFQPRITFVVIGASMILFSCLCLAAWLYTNFRRVTKVNAVRAAAEREKVSLMVSNARKSAKLERELNDFIAHEVRNPLSAAISACSFVSAAVNEQQPLAKAETRQSVREDVRIIDNSLQFINDLLRNMLDMNRASSNQLIIDLAPVDLLLDVLEPVASMLYQRGDNYEVVVDCPENLVVMSDRLRLKQIVLNLGRNSTKFVTTGFIRLRAAESNGKVSVYVEDSGPGIPVEKRRHLFRKFQESLDSLNQGTGIGLCLCERLVKLLGGELYLDETYDSGIANNPGSKFVISLNAAPMNMETTDTGQHVHTHHPQYQSHNSESFSVAHGEAQNNGGGGDTNDEEQQQHSQHHIHHMSRNLPETLSVLFVDDDLVLRKLFGRSIQRVAPGWEIREAANGETAIRLVENGSQQEDFQIIFLDQYMASVDKQLLGTETARALRARGFKGVICGLSANDQETAFLKAGADTFMFKPFPCEKEALTVELARILNHKGRWEANNNNNS